MSKELEDDVAVVYDKVGGNFKALNGDKVEIKRVLKDGKFPEDSKDNEKMDIAIEDDPRNARNSSLSRPTMYTTSGLMTANKG